MSLPLTIQFDSAAADDCPTTFIELVALLNQLISGELEGSFLPYVTGAATPSVNDQDKVWMRVDAQGRPVGTYMFYTGTWRRQYNFPIGALLFYSGDPAVDFSGANGLGTVGGEWDGFALCNGSNGTDDLSDTFLVGAKMNDLATGYPAGTGPWKTGVSGVTSQSGAGVHEVTLTEANTWQKETDAILLGHWTADGNTPNVGGGLIGLSGGGADFNLIEAGGDETPDAIPTLPPWFAYAIVRFVGFQ